MNLREALRLYVLPDADFGRGRSLLEQARAALAGGATAIQLRDKRANTRTLFEMAVEMRALCEAHGALLLVNDRLDVALAAGAHGVHLGGEDLPVERARAIAPPGFVIGASARTPEVARAAEAAGADYLGVGAMRATKTKTNSVEIGIAGLAAVRAATSLPIVAIGGVGLGDLEAIVAHGAEGVALVSAIVGAEDIEAEARTFRAALDALKRG